VKRDELIRGIRRAARDADKDWCLLREGGEHEVWGCGRTTVQIPRHREIAERTAVRILQALEAELGEDWWRR
jgi:hypothetical protein